MHGVIHQKLFSTWTPPAQPSSPNTEQAGSAPLINLPDVQSYSALTEHPDFANIKANFLADITELRQLVRFYHGDTYQSKMESFQNKININLNNPTEAELFAAYFETRKILHFLLFILKEDIPKTWDGSQAHDLEEKSQKIAMILTEVLDGMDMCLAGTIDRLSSAYIKLTQIENTLESELYQVRHDLAQDFIQSYLSDQNVIAVLGILQEMEIHWGNTLHNFLAKELNLVPQPEDFYAPSIEILSEESKMELLKEAKLTVNNFSVFSLLVSRWCERLETALTLTNRESWLHRDIPLEEFTAETLNDIEEKLLAPLNQSIQAELTPRLTFNDLFKPKNDDGDVFTLLYFREGIAAWLADALSGSEGEFFSNLTPSGDVKLASLGGVYFWVVNKSSEVEQSNIAFDRSEHTKVDLFLINSLDFSSWPQEDTIALLSQSIRQTHDAKPLAHFLIDPKAEEQRNKLSTSALFFIAEALSNHVHQKGATFMVEFVDAFIQIKRQANNKPLEDLSDYQDLINLTNLELVLQALKKNGATLSQLPKTQYKKLLETLSVNSLYQLFAAQDWHCVFDIAYSCQDGKLLEQLLLHEQFDDLLIKQHGQIRKYVPEEMLSFFASNGQLKGINYLNRKFAHQYDERSLNQYSTLTNAIRCHHIDCALALIKLPQLKVYDPNGYLEMEDDDPLTLAMKMRELALIEALLARPDIDINRSNDADAAPFVLLASSGLPDMLQLFLNHPELDLNRSYHGLPAIILAAQNNQWASVSAILTAASEKKRTLTLVSMDKTIAILTLAAHAKQWHVVEQTLKHKECLLNHCHAQSGMTLLHYAVKAGHRRLVEQLLTYPDLELNKLTKRTHLTALDLAISEQNTPMIKLLVRHSAQEAKQLQPQDAANALPARDNSSNTIVKQIHHFFRQFKR